MMLHQHKQSSSSPSLGEVGWDLPSSDASRLETSRSFSCASSIAERSVREHSRHKEAPIWRSLFIGRSQSVPDPSSHLGDHPRAGSVDDQGQDTISQDGRSTFRAELYTEAGQKWSTKIYLQRGWRYTQQSRRLNGSLPNLSQENTQNSQNMSRSRNESIHMRGSKSAAQTLSWPFRSSKKFKPGQSKRPSISTPYNFQHLAHTSPNILSKSANINADDSGDSAYGSQISSDALQDTQVNKLHSSDLFPGIVDAIVGRETNLRSPPVSPCSVPIRSNVHDVNRLSAAPVESQALRYPVWSDENKISRRSSQLLIPPPRTSSRKALTFVNVPAPIVASTTLSPTLCSGDVMAHGDEEPSLQNSHIPTGTVSTEYPGDHSWQYEEPQMPHAVTTPHDSAWPLKPARASGSRTELADVPEEDEGYHSTRAGTISSKGHSFTQLWRQVASSFDSQTTSAAPTCRTSLTSFDSVTQSEDSTRSQSQLPDPFDVSSRLRITKAPAGAAKASRRVSIEVRDLDGCWEDDVDYCYEHAVEADCTYEWGSKSDNEHESNGSKDGKGASADTTCEHGFVPSSHVWLRSSDGTYNQVACVDAEGLWKEEARASNAGRPSLVVCTVADVPDLDPTSTLSSAKDSELFTPSPLDAQASSGRPQSGSGVFRNPFKESGLFAVSDSPFLKDDGEAQIEEKSVEAETAANDGQGKRPTFEPITGPSNEMDPVDIAKSNEVDLKAKKQGEGIAQECMPRRSPSHDDALDTFSSKPRRGRSPSDGATKITSPTKRKGDSKMVKRNKSMGSFSSFQAPPPGRVSYALFPSS